MLNREICGKRLTLAAAVSLVAIGLIIPQFGHAQVPNISGNWSGTIVTNNPSQNITSTAQLTSTSTSISGSVQTNSTQFPSSSVSSTSFSKTQPQAACFGCPLPPATTSITMLFNGVTVNMKGSIDGSNFANGSFSAHDNNGHTLDGTASGTISSTSVSLKFSGTNQSGQVENGTINATNSAPSGGGGGGGGGCGGGTGLKCTL